MDEVTKVKKNGLGKKCAIVGVIVAGLAAGAYALVNKFSSNDDEYIIEDVDDDEIFEAERPIVEEKPAEK